MDIPFSDAILDDGSTEQITLDLEKTQVDWMQSRAEAKNMSVDQVARYVIDWFMRQEEDAPQQDALQQDAPQEDATSVDPESLLNRLQKTKKRLKALQGDAPSEKRASSDNKGDNKGTQADASSSEDEDVPPSMFDMARTPSESGSGESGTDESDSDMPGSDKPGSDEGREEDAPTSDVSPPKADVETHFGGPWGTEEMKKVKAALGRIEAKRSRKSGAVTPVWICTAVGGKGEATFYFATRQKTDRVFRAQTCVDLINQIAQSVNDG